MRPLTNTTALTANFLLIVVFLLLQRPQHVCHALEWSFSTPSALADFNVSGASAVAVTGGSLDLSSTNGTASLLSLLPPGSPVDSVEQHPRFRASLNFSAWTLTPSSTSHYEAKLFLSATATLGSPAAKAVDTSSTAVLSIEQFSDKNQSAGSNTWFYLNNGTVGSPAIETTSTPRTLSGQIVLALDQNTLFGWFASGPEATTDYAQFQSLDFPNASVPFPVMNSAVTIGLGVQPNFNDVYGVRVTLLDVVFDADTDWLDDDIEELIGTSPASADSDSDGVNDFDDILPLDPLVQAAFNISRLSELPLGITGKLCSSSTNGAFLALNNTVNSHVANVVVT